MSSQLCQNTHLVSLIKVHHSKQRSTAMLKDVTWLPTNIPQSLLCATQENEHLFVSLKNVKTLPPSIIKSSSMGFHFQYTILKHLYTYLHLGWLKIENVTHDCPAGHKHEKIGEHILLLGVPKRVCKFSSVLLTKNNNTRIITS